MAKSSTTSTSHKSLCCVCIAAKMEANRSGIRWHIVHTHQQDPTLSDRQIGATVGADHKTVRHWIEVHQRTGDAKDKPRSGRERLVPEGAIHKFTGIAAQAHSNELFSAQKVSQVLSSELDVTASVRTVSNSLREAGWKYGHAQRMLMLKPAHKERWLAFAKKHLSKRTAFASWMFTNSKLFQLHKTAGKPGVKVWYPSDCRPINAVVKSGSLLHTYWGATKDGLTPPIVATGGGSQLSKHINPKTGSLYTGVSALEYQHDILPKLIHEGTKIFAASGRWGAEWILQQDNARPHTAATTKLALHQMMPSRVVLDWPAMSPDLSWIESIWAWAERQLHTSYHHVKTIDELKAALTHIFKTAPKDLLQNHVRGMPKRLQKTIAANGGPIS